MRILVAVGSRSDQVCSVGAFARAEMRAFERSGHNVVLLEPTKNQSYPHVKNAGEFDVIFFHTPSLHDRIKPWNALVSALKLRLAFRRSKLITTVHEFAEAPAHWKFRQAAICALADATIVNTKADFDGVRPFSKKIFRAKLGPTLFDEEFLKCADAELEQTIDAKRRRVREEVRHLFGLRADEKWICHPGLLTPGKGVNVLTEIVGALPKSISDQTRLIVMGGEGPKSRDRDFASVTERQLKDKLADRFLSVRAPSDELFQKVLLASDLILLPYDVGVSERRSSFLSAMCSGANVWCTTGDYSTELELERSLVWQAPIALWQKRDDSVFRCVADALSENDAATLARRKQNIIWSRSRTWQNRVDSIVSFLTT